MGGPAATQRLALIRFAYKHLKDIDLVYERRIVLHFLLLDRLNCKKRLRLAVLRQVDHSKATLGQFFFEMVLCLYVALVAVGEHGGVAAPRLGTAGPGVMALAFFHY